MRVLHVLGSKIYSGAENVVIQIIKELSLKDNITMAYCSLDGPIKKVLTKEKIEFFPINKMSIKNLKKVVKKFKPDLIHAHDIKASLISSFMGIPCISHLHNNDPKMKVLSLKSILFSFRMNKFRHILSVSESVWNEFIYKKKCKKKFINVMNPICVSGIIDKSNEFVSSNYYDIGFVGRLTEQKNPLKFIDIIAKVKSLKSDVRVAIIGDGELKNQVIESIQNYDLTNNIELLGFLNNPFPVVKNFKVLCLTSEWEGFGLVAVEALSLSVPVVCFGVGGLPSIVDDQCGLICNSKEEMVNELLKLISNDNYLNFKKQNANKKSKEIDNSSEYFTKIIELYNSAINIKAKE